MEEIKKVEDIEVIEDLDYGTVAVLKGATLVEDIMLVKDYAVKNNIPFYVAIKTEKDGSEKRFYVNESGTPVVLDSTTTEKYGANHKYVAPEVVDLDEAESAIDEVAPETEVIDNAVDNSVETEELDATPTTNDPIDETIVPAELIAKSEYDFVVAQLDEANKTIADKDAEIAQLKDKIETLELTSNDTIDIEEASATDLDDVIEFMRENGLTSLSIKGE